MWNSFGTQPPLPLAAATSLEALHMEAHLAVGWAAQMAGLRQLRQLHVSCDSITPKLSAAELREMVESVGALPHLAVLDLGHMERSRFDGGALDALDALASRRPQLQITRPQPWLADT